MYSRDLYSVAQYKHVHAYDSKGNSKFMYIKESLAKSYALVVQWIGARTRLLYTIPAFFRAF